MSDNSTATPNSEASDDSSTRLNARLNDATSQYSQEKTVSEWPERNRPLDFKEPVGSFIINREIGRGGMGVVYEATEIILNRRVALKVLPPAALMDDMQIRRFRNEAAAAAQLAHPNIVPVYSVGSERGVHFYAMQLIEGQNIAQVIGSIRERLSSGDVAKNAAETPRVATTRKSIATQVATPSGSSHGEARKQLIEDEYAAAQSDRRHLHNSQRLFKTIATIGRDAARAIHHAHEVGIIHRDIKPSNLILDDKGKIWITDFGLAQIRDNPVGTGTGDIIGTLRYMSPEQASGRKFLVDHRTDIYSLGVTLYELLTLQPALNGHGVKDILRQVSFEEPVSIRHINSRIPRELEVIINKSIAKNPQDRYHTAADLAEDLDRFCNDQPIAARKPTLLQKARRWTAVHQAAAGMIAIGLGCVFCASLGMTALMIRSNQIIAVEKSNAIHLLSESEGYRLTANATAFRDQNPGLSLALALEGSKRVSGLEVNSAIQDALDRVHEIKLTQMDALGNRANKLTLAPRSQYLLSIPQSVSGETESAGPALITDLRTDKVVTKLDAGTTILSAAFSPNEEFVLSVSRASGKASDPKEISTVTTVWEAQSGRKLKTLGNHVLRDAQSFCFSPDSSALVLPGPGNDATVYRTDGLSLQFTLRGGAAQVLSASFSPNGKYIATLDLSDTITLWNAADGTLVQSIAAEKSAKSATQMEFSFDSNFILLASRIGTTAYAIENKDKATPIFWRETNFVLAPSSNRCACFTPWNRRVTLRDIKTGEALCELDKLPQQTSSLETIQIAFVDNGQRLAVALGNEIRLVDALSGMLASNFRGHTAPVSGLLFNKLTEQFLSAAHDGTIRFWRQQPGRSLFYYPMDLDGRGLNDVVASTDSRYLMQPSTLERQTAIFEKSGEAISSTLPTGGYLASNFDADHAFLWQYDKITYINPTTSRSIRSRSFPEESIKHCTALNKSTCCILQFEQQPPLYWHAENDELFPLISNDDELKSVSVDKADSQFVLGTANGYCQLHESSTGKLTRRLRQTSSVQFACTTPDKTRILTVDNQSRLRVWGDDDLLPQSIIQESGYLFNNCVVSADSKFVITFNDDKASEVRCWELATGKLIHKTEGAVEQHILAHPTKPIVFLGSRSLGLQQWDLEANRLQTLSPNVIINMILAGNDFVTREFPQGFKLPASEIMRSPLLSEASVRSYAIDGGEQTGEFKVPFATVTSKLSVSQDGQKIGLSYSRYSATLIDRETPKWRTQVGAHAEPISFAAFIGKSNEVITASWDGLAKIWDEQYQLRHTLQSESGAAVTCGATSSNEDLLALGYKDGTIIVWDIRKGEKLVVLRADETRIESIGLDETAQHLVSSDSKGVVRYWTLLSRENVICSKEGEASSAILSPDEQQILLLGWEESNGQIIARPARVFNLKSGKHTDLPGTFNALAGNFSSDGKQLGLALTEGSAVILTLNEAGLFEAQKTISIPDVSIEHIAFGADGWVALKSTHELLLYDIEEQQIQEHRHTVKDMQIVSGLYATRTEWNPFTPEQQWLALATFDGLEVLAMAKKDAIGMVTNRVLTEFEKRKFRVGLTDQVQMQIP